MNKTNRTKFGRTLYLISMNAGKVCIQPHPKVFFNGIDNKKNIVGRMRGKC